VFGCTDSARCLLDVQIGIGKRSQGLNQHAARFGVGLDESGSPVRQRGLQISSPSMQQQTANRELGVAQYRVGSMVRLHGRHGNRWRKSRGQVEHRAIGRFGNLSRRRESGQRRGYSLIGAANLDCDRRSPAFEQQFGSESIPG
jgi:hypothetical protein